MTEKYKRKPDQLLMDSIGFDEDDLAANRAGKMGTNQQSRLRWMQRQTQASGSLMALMTVAVSVLSLILVVIGLFRLSQEWLFGLLIFIGGMAFFGRKALQSFQLSDAQRTDLLTDDIAQIEGRVSLDVQTRNNKSGASSVEYSVRLEGREWIVTREVFLAFKNGDPYALYYAPRSNVLLAAEWLREPPPGMDIPADAEDEEGVDTQEKPKHGGIRR